MTPDNHGCTNQQNGHHTTRHSIQTESKNLVNGCSLTRLRNLWDSLLPANDGVHDWRAVDGRGDD